MTYFELDQDLSPEDETFREEMHEFAREVIRPYGDRLEDLSPEEKVQDDSPLWEFYEEAYSRGYHCLALPEELGGRGLTPLQNHIQIEEWSWGSYGLAATFMATAIPFNFLAQHGSDRLVEEFVVPFAECQDGSIRGCWGVTEPDHGSDTLASHNESFEDADVFWQVEARRNGDEWILNGKKSPWVTGGGIATHTLVHAGVDPDRGMAGAGIFLCPLDRGGVSRGELPSMMGARDMNQGQIVFEDVRIPDEYRLYGPEDYKEIFDLTLAPINAGAGVLSVGVARAAYEEALEYARNRVQGGKPLVEHASVRERLFRMFSDVETARAISRRVLDYNMDPTVDKPLLEYGSIVNVKCSELAFDVADEALQIMGAKGLSNETRVEKLFRDARTNIIADGPNEQLASSAGQILAKTYPRS